MGPRDTSGSTGPPDRQTLRLFERHLSSESLVDETAFEPETHEPRLLSAVLDTEQYPESTASVRLNIRWFTTGDFSFHYIETQSDGSQWECRWDRHPNTHSARLHFHQPPDATTITDLSLSSLHPLSVSATVLRAVEQRLETLWSTSSASFSPAELKIAWPTSEWEMADAKSGENSVSRPSDAYIPLYRMVKIIRVSEEYHE